MCYTGIAARGGKLRGVGRGKKMKKKSNAGCEWKSSRARCICGIINNSAPGSYATRAVIYSVNVDYVRDCGSMKGRDGGTEAR